MHIPDNMTKDQVVDQINVVVNRIAPKYTFYGYQADDPKQEAFIICMEALPRYDAKRPLENFLSVHLSNRLKNFVRDNHFQANEDEKAKVVMPGQLAALYRADYLKIINDVYVPKKKKEEVLFIIQTILEEHGYEEG